MALYGLKNEFKDTDGILYILLWKSGDKLKVLKIIV